MRFRSLFSFTARKENLHAIRTRSNDCYRPRILALSSMTNAEPAARRAHIRKISRRSRMTLSLRCGERSELQVGGAPGSDIRAVVRAGGSRRLLQHERLWISLLSVSA